jgi:hypothetical protein
MPIASETTAIFLVVIVALGILIWGFRRSRTYGKLGILAWLQSVILISPWLIFFGLFALGIYLNLIGIVLLLLVSSGVYIWLGKKLRAAGQEEMLRERAAQRLKMEAESDKSTDNSIESPKNLSNEVLPIPAAEIAQIKTIFSNNSLSRRCNF